MRSHHPLIAALVLFAAAGCDQQLPTALGVDSADASSQTGLYSSSAGMTVASLSGTIGIVGGEGPARVVITPSGVCHLFQMPAFTYFDGDVEGFVTFEETIHDMWCDGTMLIISSPIEGEVTWNGLTGFIEGQAQINCRADDTPPFPTCVTKVMNARGSGDLEGVLFHFDLEPGWFPFDYSGKVFSR